MERLEFKRDGGGRRLLQRGAQVGGDDANWVERKPVPATLAALQTPPHNVRQRGEEQRVFGSLPACHVGTAIVAASKLDAQGLLEVHLKALLGPE